MVVLVIRSKQAIAKEIKAALSVIGLSVLGYGQLNIKDFRAVTDEALRHAGLEEFKLPRKPYPINAWQLPADDLIRFFSPHAYRQPWGFVFSGYIGIEIPELRTGLDATKTKDEVGVFHTNFVGYNILNEDGLRDFMVEHGKPVPASTWAQKIRERLADIPSTTSEMKTIYRSNREALSWLAAPLNKPIWDFYFMWSDNRKPTLEVPRMSPTGQIG